MKNVSILDIIAVYEQEIKKHTKNKRKIYQFEKYFMQNIIEVYNTLKNINSNYLCYYNIFLIYEPKCRVIMSLNIKDKLINHYIARKILIEKLEKYLIDRNVATRKNMGTDYGRNLIKKYLEINKRYGKFYILKLDISKYFYSIDHNVLKNLLKEKLDNHEYQIIATIIDTTNQNYINEKIKALIKKHKIDLPLYKKNKGLPIGNITSQFLAVFYLYKLDYEIVHKLGISSYAKYMDDFILIHPNKEKLVEALKYIKNELENTYKLKLNLNKTKIVDNREGFTFLGYHYRVINNKTITSLIKSNRQKIKKKIINTTNQYKNKHKTFEQAFCSMQTFINNYKYGSKMYVKRLVERYWFDEFRK